jgi:hypothetical protein
MPKTTTVTEAYAEAKQAAFECQAAHDAAVQAEATAYIHYGSDSEETRAATTALDKARLALRRANEIVQTMKLPALQAEIVDLTKDWEHAKYERGRCYEEWREGCKLSPGDPKNTQLKADEIEYDKKVRAIELKLANIRSEMVAPPPIPELRSMADVLAACSEIEQSYGYGGYFDQDKRPAARFCGSLQYIVNPTNSALAAAVQRWFDAHPADRDAIRLTLTTSSKKAAKA